jgi:diguanylate cyclase (GGDEF)-like protein
MKVLAILLAAAPLLWCGAPDAAAPPAPFVSGPAESVTARAFRLPVRRFGAEAGLPDDNVHAMVLAPDGHLLVGTTDGLSRYDGVRFEPLPLPKPGRRPTVVSLLRDGESVWIGTDEAGLWRLEGEAFVEVGAEGLTEERDGRPRLASLPRIFSIAAAADGVWVACEAGVFRCSKSTCRRWTREPAAAVLEGRWAGERVLWVGVDAIGLVRLRLTDEPLAGELAAAGTVLSRRDGLPNNAVRALIQWGGEHDEDLWIGTGLGVARQTTKGITRWMHETHSGVMHAFGFSPYQRADGERRLRVALGGGGIGEWREDGNFTRISVHDGLPSDRVRSLLATGGEGGPLWIGTLGAGLARLEAGLWRQFDEADGLPHRTAIAVGEATFPDGRRSHWIATAKGAVRFVDGRWRPFLPALLREREITAIAPREGGGLWLATDIGLAKWEGGKPHIFNLSNSRLPGLQVTSLAEFTGLGRRAVWLSTRHGIARIVGDAIERIDLSPELPAGSGAGMLLAVPQLDGGSLFAFGTGITWLRADGRRSHIGTPCLPHEHAIAGAWRDADELWVGTRGGLARIRFLPAGPSCESMPPQLLPPRAVKSVLVGRDGMIYVFSYGSAARLVVSREEALDRSRVEFLGPGDGLRSMEFQRDGFVDADSRIWVTTSAGVAMLEPGPPPATSGLAQLRFTHASADGRALRPGASVPFGAAIALRWRLLDFSREDRVRYRTQWVGIDAEPGKWEVRNELPQSRLPAGNYELRVWARDAHGAEHGPVAFGFTVAPPWWLQPWFLSAAALAALLAIGTFVHWRDRVLRARAAMLERIVGERTEALRQANAELDHLANSDALTGVFNRRHFYEHYRGRIFDQPVALVFLDIDHFKNINDRHGHGGGDAVLVETARRLTALGAPVFRMGGEEFLLLPTLADVAPPELGRWAEKILGALRASPMEVDGRSLDVRCSVGIAVHPFGSAPAPALDVAMTLADRALYRAKQNGRDRAVLVMPLNGHYCEAESNLEWIEVV